MRFLRRMAGFMDGCSWISFRGKHISRAAASVKQRLVRGRIDFAPNAIHVDLDQIGEGVEFFIPDVLGDFRPANDTAGVSGEKLYERILFSGEGHCFASAGNTLSDGIDDQVSNHDFGRAQLSGAAEQSAQTRQQFSELEWLCEVVIRAAIESGNAILDSVASSKHEDGHTLAGFS